MCTIVPSLKVTVSKKAFLFLICSLESNQLSSNAVVRLVKSLLGQKVIEEFRASNQVNRACLRFKFR